MSSDQSTSNHLNQNTKPGLQKPNLTFAPDIKHPPHSSFIKDQTKTIRTVPNSPYIDSCSTPPPPPSSSNTLLSGSRPLTKVKSLGKIDIRSPIPINSVLQTPRIPALDQLQDETYSLRTTQTNESMRSRFFGKVHDTFISIRIFYNDFTTIDWTKAYLKGNQFNYSIEKKQWIGDDSVNDGQAIPFLHRAYYTLGKWFLILIIAFFFSIIAFCIDKVEILLVGFKHGYCRSNWFASQISCCIDNPKKLNVFKSGYVTNNTCDNWVSWNKFFHEHWLNTMRFDFIIYVVLTILLAMFACLITLSTKITGGSIPEDQSNHGKEIHADDNENATNQGRSVSVKPRVIYTATGSGVPEVKTILSGFVIRRFLGTYTLIAKTVALVFAIALGMSLGKEGPYVHLATCVGNITSRFFPFIYENDFFEKQILSASASAGVALAFGSPLGGVLFILEEINNYLPSNQLFQIFFCAIISTLFLKFLNPYGTGKTVLFELEYFSDWSPMELIFFVVIGIMGGVFGASFIKFSQWWAKKFRSNKHIKTHPIFEVFLVAAVTGIISFWNPYTKQASAELVLDLATPCSGGELDRSLCPQTEKQLLNELASLLFAFVVKVFLTFITFGLKLPCGIYVPSMVCGALFGRIFALFIRWLEFLSRKSSSSSSAFSTLSLPAPPLEFGLLCSSAGPHCVDMGIYAMISAGAFMAGVTRMNITLVTILFELTSSYTYVLPISIAIAVANWSGGLLEKNSLYESLLISNDYSFMAPETEPIDPYVSAGDIINQDSVPTTRISRHIPPDRQLYIDVSDSGYVPVSTLESKLQMLADRCLLDGCIALIKNQLCVGLLFFLELEICLDQIRAFTLKHDVKEELYCNLFDDDDGDGGGVDNKSLSKSRAMHNDKVVKNILNQSLDYFNYGAINEDEYLEMKSSIDVLTNLTNFVDRVPMFINYDTELCFAHLIFDRIGNRVIVLIKDGKYYGVLHKKVLIDYLRRTE